MQEVLETEGYTAVKLERLRSGYLTVVGKINGKGVRLIVDTGANSSFLDRKRTARFDLEWQPGSVFQKRDGGTGPVMTFVEDIELGRFHTGRLRIQSHDLAELNLKVPEYGDPPSDGLLGADVLGQSWAVIDYGTDRLFLLGQKDMRRIRGPKDMQRNR
jgi:hypothetical protein